VKDGQEDDLTVWWPSFTDPTYSAKKPPLLLWRRNPQVKCDGK